MKTIDRYPLPNPQPGLIQHVLLPEQHKIQKVWTAYGVPQIIAEIDTGSKPREYHYTWMRERHPFPGDEDHVFTFQYIGSTCPVDEMLHLYMVVICDKPEDLRRGGTP